MPPRHANQCVNNTNIYEYYVNDIYEADSRQNRLFVHTNNLEQLDIQAVQQIWGSLVGNTIAFSIQDKELLLNACRAFIFFRLLLLLAGLALLTGCPASILGGRVVAQDLAARGGFKPIEIETAPFVLSGWLRPGTGQTLHVYFEGDGLAWRSRTRPAMDPTPSNPVSLRLALTDPTAEPVLYLARPCQYTEGEARRGCFTPVWTHERFSEQVVAAENEAVDQIKARLAARSTALYGYSGGGSVAVLVAARRSDVVFLATVAGDLDHELWTRTHGVSPLTGSLNPADVARAVAHIPQLHVTGGADEIIPPEIADSYCARLGGAQVIRETLPGLGHDGAWEKSWPGLLSRYRSGN